MKKALSIFLFFLCLNLDAQHTYYSQDFENPTVSCPENWNYSGGVRTTETAFSGSYSLRVGRLGESHTVTFDAVDVSELINGELTLRHRVLPGMGPGLDTREGAAFLISLNGGPYTFISGISGYGDINHTWTQAAGSAATSSGCNSYQTPNPFSYSIPPGTSTISLKIVSIQEGNCTSFNNSMENGIGKEFNRSDEGIYLDGITITGDAPTLTIPSDYCGGSINTLPSISENGISGTWSPSTIASSGTYTFSPNMGNCISNSFQINVTPQPPQPATACYETATWSETNCVWEITGTQPAEPTTACYETATWNETICAWEITGSQAPMPAIDCHETTVFDEASCGWIISGDPIITLLEEEICASELPYDWNGVIFNAAGSQSIVEQAANGCDSTITLELSVIEIPDFTISYEESSDCENLGSIIISGLNPNIDCSVSSNMTSESDYMSDSDGEISLDNLSDGSYSEFTVSVGSCSKTIFEEILLSLPTPPSISAGTDTSLCEGQTLTLTATNPDNAAISWSNNVQDGVVFTPPLGTTIYTATASKDGCETTDDIIVKVFATPTVDAGNDLTVCEGESATLTASNPDNAAITWDNNVEDGVTIEPPLGETTYVVSAALGNCTNTDEIKITVEPSISASILPFDSLLCKGESIEFSYELLNGNPVSCLWEFGDGANSSDCQSTSYTYASDGCFDVTLTLTNAGGCSSNYVISDAVCVLEGPTAAFDMNTSTITSFDNTVHFTNLSQNASNYTWDFGDNSFSSSEENPHHSYINQDQDAFEVTLIASDENDCIDSTSKIITFNKELLYYIPNAFTPDGLNGNNTFQAVLESTDDLEEYSFIIFNRWGNVVFETTDETVAWDGTFQGKAAPEGVYVWKISYRLIDTVTNRKDSGHVTLLR